MVLRPFLLSLRHDVQSDDIFLYCRRTDKKVIRKWRFRELQNSLLSCAFDADFYELFHLLLRSFLLDWWLKKVQNDIKVKVKNTDFIDRNTVTWWKQPGSCKLSSWLCFGLLNLLFAAVTGNDFVSSCRKLQIQSVTHNWIEHHIFSNCLEMEALSQVNQCAQSFPQVLLQHFCLIFGHLLLVLKSYDIAQQSVHYFDVRYDDLNCSHFDMWICEDTDLKNVQKETLNWQRYFAVDFTQWTRK